MEGKKPARDLWAELRRLALTGTDRAHLAEEAMGALSQRGAGGQGNETEALLEGLARLSRRLRAGYVPPAFSGILPAAPAEATGTLCSPLSSDHLRLILEGPFEAALPEFVGLLHTNQRRLPPERLPELLDQCREQPELWPSLRSAIGQRGRWLMTQNPDWRSLEPPADPAAWPALSATETARALQQFRYRDPDGALTWLREAWPGRSWREKLPLLEALAAGASSQDEAFLEEALDDRRKEVRMAAAALLAVRPDTELVRRAEAWARQMIRPGSGKGLQVELPADPSPSMIRDGIPDLARTSGRSLRRNRLMEIVRRVPPESWEDHLNTDAAGCIEAFATSEYADDLLEAITEATYHFQATAWMLPLFRSWHKRIDRSAWKGIAAQRLMRDFPPEVFEAICAEATARNEHLVAEEAPFTQLLLLNAHDWPDSLTFKLVRGFQQWLGDVQQFYWSTWHYKQLWKVAAYRADPALFDTLQEGWPQQARQWPAWEKDIERMLRTWLFRRDMRSALAGESSTPK